MKIGDVVRHNKKGKFGIVLACMSKKYKNFTRFYVKVDWADGTDPWYIAEHRVEVISESR